MDPRHIRENAFQLRKGQGRQDKVRSSMFLQGKLGMLFCLGSLWSLPQAADIYRWVDDSGRTHLSDSVPDQYRKSATKVDARKFEATQEQRRAAEERAERDRARAKAIEEQSARGASQDAARASANTSPKTSVSTATDCEQQYKRYWESLDCFAPYVMANGATRVEAYSKCAPVKDPNPQCGPSKPRGSTSRTY
jgi:hypothetical protein